MHSDDIAHAEILVSASIPNLVLVYENNVMNNNVYTAISQLDNLINKFIVCFFESANNDTMDAILLEYSNMILGILFDHPNNKTINKQIRYITRFLVLLHTNTNYIYKYYFTLKFIDLRLDLFIKYNMVNVIENIIYEFDTLKSKIETSEDWIIGNELIFNNVISLFDKIIMRMIEIV